MVLCTPCGTGELLEALRERGVPAVGLDRDGDAVRAVRRRGLPAFRGTWRALPGRPPGFDGICAAWSGPPRSPARTLEAYAEALLDGGLLVLTGPREILAALDDVTPPTLEAGPRAGGARAFLRRRRPGHDAPRKPGESEVGACADTFAGRGKVLELAPGEGRFLDALRVRDVPCAGLETDPARIARCRARGHRVQRGAADVLGTLRDRYDGIWIGRRPPERASGAAVDVLLRLSLRALRPGGTLQFPVRGPSEAARWIARVRGPGVKAARALAPPRAAHACLVAVERDGNAPPDTGPAAAWWPGITPHPLDGPPGSLFDLERFERRDFSQGGEDGVLEAVFERIGVGEGTFVELGCGDAVQCNTKALRERGWRGLLVDGSEPCRDPRARVVRAWVTAENVERILSEHGAPHQPDLLSIDLDGNDYWVWRALRRRARVVVIEYNANWGPDARLTIPYDPARHWDGTDAYGASLAALVELGRAKGYTLVHCSTSGVNAFFVADELIGESRRPGPRELYRPPNYWYRGARHVPNLEHRPIAPPALDRQDAVPGDGPLRTPRA